MEDRNPNLPGAQARVHWRRIQQPTELPPRSTRPVSVLRPVSYTLPQNLPEGARPCQGPSRLSRPMGARPPPQAPMTNPALPFGPPLSRPSPPRLAMTHSPQRSGTFILAPAVRKAQGKGRVGPTEPARGSPQSPRTQGKGSSASAHAPQKSQAGGTKEGEEEGRANLEPTNDSSAIGDLAPAEPPERERTACREGSGACSPGEKAEVERGQDGREGGCAPPPPSSFPYSHPGLVDGLLGPPGFHTPT